MRLKRSIMIVVLSLGLFTAIVFGDFVGTGEPNDPYQLSAAQDFYTLVQDPNLWDKAYVLTSDIDLDPNSSFGRVFSLLVAGQIAFSGQLDGDGHVIRNMTIDSNEPYLGLFASIDPNGSVLDLGLEDVNITGQGHVVGALAGLNRGTITCCYSTGSVQGRQAVGGLVGQNGSFLDDDPNLGLHACYSHCDVNGVEFVGGLAGFNLASLTHSYSAGFVDGDAYVGGLTVGVADLNDCFWDVNTAWQAFDFGGMALTTTEMQDVNTYLDAGWDFVDETANGPNDLWAMSSSGYPIFFWLVDPNTPDGPTGMVWAEIPGGSFEMGDHAGVGNSNALPIHTVTLDSFRISVYETTNAQYAEYLNAALADGLIQVVDGVVCSVGDSSYSERYCDMNSYDSDSQIEYSQGRFTVRYRDGYDMSDHPVVEVSWYGATAFCDYYGYRLPTEAEWEYAARGGYHDPYYQYPWGSNVIDFSKANYWDSVYNNPLDLTSFPYTSPVGTFGLQGGYGLCDIAGNVWEWCSDWYDSDYYSESPESNPTGPEEGAYRVLRGGVWNRYDHCCRSALRFWKGPSVRGYSIGFRACLPGSALD